MGRTCSPGRRDRGNGLERGAECDDGGVEDHRGDIGDEEIANLERARVPCGRDGEQDRRRCQGNSGAERPQMLVHHADANFGLFLLPVAPRPGGPGRSFRPGRLQLADAVDELRQVAREQALLAQPEPLRGQLRGPQRHRHGERGDADAQGRPAERGIVEEHQDDRRDEKQDGQHRGSGGPGQPVAQGLEGHRPHGCLARTVAAVEPCGQAQQTVPEGGGRAGREPALDPHDRVVAQHMGQRRREREQDQQQRQLEERAAVVRRDHAVDQHADAGRRRQGQDTGRQACPDDTDEIRAEPAGRARQQRPQAGGTVVGQRLVENVAIRCERGGLPPTGPRGRACPGIEQPVPPRGPGKECDGPAAGAPKGQHGPTVTAPPALLRQHAHPSCPDSRCAQQVRKVWRLARTAVRRPDGDALMASNRAQRRDQCAAAGVRRAGRREEREQLAPSLVLVAPPPDGTFDLETGLVGHQHPAIEHLRRERHPVESRQGAGQQRFGAERVRRQDRDVRAPPNAGPAFRRDRHEFAFLRILRAEEERRRALDPDHATGARHDPFDSGHGPLAEQPVRTRMNLDLGGDRRDDAGDPVVGVGREHALQIVAVRARRESLDRYPPQDCAGPAPGRQPQSLGAGGAEGEAAGLQPQRMPKRRLVLAVADADEKDVEGAPLDEPQAAGIVEGHETVAAGNRDAQRRGQAGEPPTVRTGPGQAASHRSVPAVTRHGPAPHRNGLRRRSDRRGCLAAPPAPGRGRRSSRCRGSCSGGGRRSGTSSRAGAGHRRSGSP